MNFKTLGILVGIVFAITLYLIDFNDLWLNNNYKGYTAFLSFIILTIIYIRKRKTS